MRSAIRQLVPALMVLVCMSLLLGVAYPVAVWGIGRVGFSHRADGSLIKRDGVVVGSSLLGQPFSDPKYFHPRPSAAGTGYDAMSSGASNLGPSNPDLLATIAQRVKDYRAENSLSDTAQVPVDAVTASASGLDPEISIANARLQAARVATVRSIDLQVVLTAVGAAIVDRPLQVLGDPGVNVVRLNMALDAL